MENNVSTIPTVFNCNINGKVFALHGVVKGVIGSGDCEAIINYESSELPSGFRAEILSYVAITGYAAMSLCIGEAQNPFSEEKIDFAITRKLDLGARGSLNTLYWANHRSTKDETLTFNVDGTVDVPELVDMHAVLESWTPNGPQSFKGEMAFIWTAKDGQKIVGNANSVYKINAKNPLTRPQLRAITFSLQRKEGVFIQKEHIKLFDSAEWDAMFCDNQLSDNRKVA